ncbi:MAG TPA: dethiobiotin synthase [Lachnospiraceae bacterium]|nr:dethiobiotin synthase [Lachnospiraceae bacterium]
MAKALFITGTGTDVGKTFVTGLIVKKLKDSGRNAAYYKAAMSGNERRPDGSLIPGDAMYVKKISGISQPPDTMCPYLYEAAVSPHLASRMEGNPVQMDVVKQGYEKVCRTYDYVTMEGSGGILCPVCFDEEKLWLEDIIRGLHLSCLLVADAGLGTINSVVLTTEYMRAKKLPVKGILFNRFHPGDPMEEDNLRMCEYRTGLPVLACIQENDPELSIDAEQLASLYE